MSLATKHQHISCIRTVTVATFEPRLYVTSESKYQVGIVGSSNSNSRLMSTWSIFWQRLPITPLHISPSSGSRIPLRICSCLFFLFLGEVHTSSVCDVYKACNLFCLSLFVYAYLRLHDPDLYTLRLHVLLCCVCIHPALDLLGEDQIR